MKASRREFVERIHRAAARVVAVRGGERWLAWWMTAIACLESAWGEKAVGHNTVGYHWIPGMKWSGKWLDRRETMSRKVRRYRYFESDEECMEALYYLIARSRIYAEAREAYRVAAAEAELALEKARLDFVDDFSGTYCPKDGRHGKKVMGVMGKIRELVPVE